MCRSLPSCLLALAAPVFGVSTILTVAHNGPLGPPYRDSSFHILTGISRYLKLQGKNLGHIWSCHFLVSRISTTQMTMPSSSASLGWTLVPLDCSIISFCMLCFLGGGNHLGSFFSTYWSISWFIFCFESIFSIVLVQGRRPLFNSNLLSN